MTSEAEQAKSTIRRLRHRAAMHREADRHAAAQIFDRQAEGLEQLVEIYDRFFARLDEPQLPPLRAFRSSLLESPPDGRQ